MQARNVKFIQERLGGISIIRSAELATAAFSLGLFDDLIPKMQKGKELLLDAVLWGVKSNGCAITENEIEEIKKMMLNK